jgi:replicative DNA helicase
MNNTKTGSSPAAIKPPPHSEDAEKGILGCLLLGGEYIAAELGTMIREGHFFIPAHAIVWRAAMGLIAQRKGTDFRLVKQRLADAGELEEIGGAEALSDFYGFVLTAVNCRYYAEIVLEKYLLREAIAGSARVMNLALDPGEGGFKVVRQEIEQTLTALTLQRVTPDMTAAQITDEWLEDVENRAARLKQSGIEFGIPALDEVIGPQRAGECSAIGAEISGGKSLFAAQGALFNLGRGRPVALASMEMTKIQYWDRMAAHLEGVSMKSLRRGTFTQEENTKLGKAVLSLKKMPFHYCQGILDWDGIKAYFRRMKAKHAIALGIIDYLQRVRIRGGKGQPRFNNREEEMTYISNELKDLGIELDMVFWYPIQLNEEGAARSSRMIMADADNAVKIINEADQAEKTNNKKSKTRTWTEEQKQLNHVLVVTKARQAARRINIPIRVVGEFMRIEQRETTEDAPEWNAYADS